MLNETKDYYDEIPRPIKNKINGYYYAAAVLASCFIIVAITGVKIPFELAMSGVISVSVLTCMGLHIRYTVLKHGYVAYAGICKEELPEKGFGNGKKKNYIIEAGEKMIKLSVIKSQHGIPEGSGVLIFTPYNVKEHEWDGLIYLSSYYAYVLVPV